MNRPCNETETVAKQDGTAGKAQKSIALRALTSSALALPGLAGIAGADSPTADTVANYSFSHYKESNLAVSNWAEAFGGSRERYEIIANQFNVVTPITSRIDASFDLVYETMSGASPWYVIPETGTGKPLTVMTGATIEDARVDGQLTVNHYFDRARLSLSGGVSSEKDYLSGNFGFSGERNYNDKNTTLAGGVAFSWDTIMPTDPTDHGHQAGAEFDKKTIGLFATFSQILYKHAVMQLGINYKHSDGFLSDPYKRVFFENLGSGTNDTRPDIRNQVTLLGRYRQFIPAANASLHFDLQAYFDDWDIWSMSMQAAWYQTLFEHFQVIPSMRYYSQSQASFYAPFFPGSPGDPGAPKHYSSDYRLSPFGAITAGLRVEADVDSWPGDMQWKVGLSFDQYWSDGGFALGTVNVANPGLVNYRLISVQIGSRF